MKSLLAVSLVAVLLGFSNGAMAQEWSTPESLRAFGKPGDTVRGGVNAEPKKSSSAMKNKKIEKKQTDEQPDNSQPYVFNSDYLEKNYGKTTPEQRAREVKRANEEDKRWQNKLKVREAEQNAKNEQIREREKQEANARNEALRTRNQIDTGASAYNCRKPTPPTTRINSISRNPGTGTTITSYKTDNAKQYDIDMKEYESCLDIEKIKAGGNLADIKKRQRDTEQQQQEQSSAPIERGLSVNGVPATSVGGGNYIDNTTGHFLQGAAGGVIDTRTGQFLPTH